MDHSTKLDASVGASSARFPKFVHRCSTLFRELRKAKGTSKLMISSAAFDLKFLLRTRSKLCRNFKSAALAPHDFAVRFQAPFVFRRQSVHRIPRFTSVTIAKRPSREGGTAKDIDLIWVNNEADYFCRQDWTSGIALSRFMKFGFRRSIERPSSPPGAQSRTRRGRR